MEHRASDLIRTCYITKFIKKEKKRFDNFNPHKPVAQKAADEGVFRRFQGEGVEFF